MAALPVAGGRFTPLLPCGRQVLPAPVDAGSRSIIAVAAEGGPAPLASRDPHPFAHEESPAAGGGASSKRQKTQFLIAALSPGAASCNGESFASMSCSAQRSPASGTGSSVPRRVTQP